jgi:hypothetical protein
MFPFLKDGDVIQVAPANIEALRVGDIIFYRSGDRMLAHRVVGLGTTPEGKYARARGDAFLQEDPLVSEGDLLGKVELVSRPSCGSWHQIQLTEGWARLLGDLVARSKVAHRSVRCLSRLRLRLEGGYKKLLQVGKDQRGGTTVDAETQEL